MSRGNSKASGIQCISRHNQIAGKPSKLKDTGPGRNTSVPRSVMASVW